MVEDHRHCIVCGKATDVDKSICGPSCDEALKLQQKKAGRSKWLMILMFGAMIAVFMLLPLLTPAAPAAP